MSDMSNLVQYGVKDALNRGYMLIAENNLLTETLFKLKIQLLSDSNKSSNMVKYLLWTNII